MHDHPDLRSSEAEDIRRDSPDRGLDQAEIAAAEGAFQAGTIATGRHGASDDSGPLSRAN